MVTNPDARRSYRAHPPLVRPLNPLMACHHSVPACNRCVPEGTLLFRNHDIEASSWWTAAPRGKPF